MSVARPFHVMDEDDPYFLVQLKQAMEESRQTAAREAAWRAGDLRYPHHQNPLQAVDQGCVSAPGAPAGSRTTIPAGCSGNPAGQERDAKGSLPGGTNLSLATSSGKARGMSLHMALDDAAQAAMDGRGIGLYMHLLR